MREAGMKIKIAYYILIFSLLSSMMFAQEWVKKMEDPNVNFYEVQREFQEYWQGKEIPKGAGWKPFKRWEYFMEPRVYPSGERFAPNQAAREFQTYQAKYDLPVDNAANWTPLGPYDWTTVSYNPGIGRVNVTAVDPANSNIIYVGAPSGGFWKSTDGGNNWETSTDDLTVLGVSAIAIDPANSNTIYIGTGDGDGSDTYSIGVLKSVDGGANWSPTGLNWTVTQFRQISKLLIHPSNSTILLAATNVGVYKSTDSGSSWNLTQSGNFKDMEFKPGDPSTVYVCGTTFYRSTNTGDSFTQVTSGIPTAVNRLAIAVSPDNSNYVYLLGGSSSDSGFEGLYRSSNSGVSFTTRSTSPNILGYSETGATSGGQSWYDLAIAVDPTDAEDVYVGGINIWKSTNGGTSWTINAYWYYFTTSIPYVHADIHTLEFYNNRLLAGCDGGIFETTNGGSSWTDLSAGIANTQFYRMGGYPGDDSLVIAGAQDNGTMRFDGAWTHVLGADGMEAMIDYNNPQTMYACIQNGGLRRSLNGGASFSSITSGISENGYWVTPFVMDPNDSQTLYAGFVNVWKSENRGSSWSTISSFGGSSTLRSLAVAPSNNNYIYTATTSTLRRTTNGGSSWNNISSGLPTSSAAISYIAIARDDPLKVWVTFSGYSSGNKVFNSTDGGANWSNISGTLPNLPVNCVAYQPNSNDAVYIGSDIGIYYRDNNKNDWELYNDGLPNVIVSELEVHEASGKLRAATYGRGLWESALQPPADADDPNPPENFLAYSDYTSPTGMQLTWTDPTTYFNGEPLTNFTIEIYRDDVFVTSRSSGAESYTDNGLTDGQEYKYTIYTKDNDDSLSGGVDAGWTAGGAAEPQAPTNVSIQESTTEANTLEIFWTNPAKNIDDTPMDDLAGIRLYEDGIFLQMFARTSGDSAKNDSAIFTGNTGLHSYHLTAIDNENPLNESVASATASPPLIIPFSDEFPTTPDPNPAIWINTTAEVNTVGINPPSSPNVLSLDGLPSGGETVTVRPINLSGLENDNVKLKFSYQPQGSGNAPETGDSLAVDFLNSLGQWKKVRGWPGTTQVPFVEENIDIASENAGSGATFFYNGFQFRFRNIGTQSSSSQFDHWLIDDVSMTTEIPPAINVAPDSLPFTLSNGDSGETILTISNTVAAGGQTLDWSVVEAASNIPPANEKRHRKQRPVANDNYRVTVSQVSGLETVLFNDDMESGTNGWTTELIGGSSDDLWHQTTTNANSATTSWWCGVVGQGNYNTGSQINTALISPVVDLSSVVAPVTLSFAENYDTESGWDYCMVDASTDGGSNWTSLRGGRGAAPSGNSGGWVNTNLDLSAYVGEQLQIRFYFDTDDGIANSNPGWFVDDVNISDAFNDIVPWLSVAPASGSTDPQNNSNLTVKTFSEGLSDGIYTALLNINSNDPENATVAVPVHLTVVNSLGIGGKVNYGSVGGGADNSKPVENLAAYLEEVSAATQSTTSNSSGQFSFMDLNNGSDYNLWLDKADGGNSTIINPTDALLAFDAFLGNNTLNGIQNLAGDVDSSLAIDPADALLIFNRYLEVISSFPIDDWRVFPANYNIDANNAAWANAPSLLSYNNLSASQWDQDFIAVLKGDVNLDWNPPTPLVNPSTLAKSAGASEAYKIFFKISAGTVSPRNGEISWHVWVGGPAMQQSLQAFGVDIVFNASQFSVVDVAWSDILPQEGFQKGYNLISSEMQDDPTAESMMNETVLRLGGFTTTSAGITHGGNLVKIHGRLSADITPQSEIPITIRNVSASVINPLLDNKTAGKNSGGKFATVAASGETKLLKVTELPETYDLAQNYPNPFNPVTTIRYQLPENARVSLAIYNTLGQKIATLVKNVTQSPGYYEVAWQGRDFQEKPVASGIYFYRLEAVGQTGQFSRTFKMMLLK